MINDLLPLVNLLGFLAFIGSGMFLQWKTGSSAALSRTIKILQDKDTAQQDLIDDQMAKIHNMTIQLETLKTQLNEKNKKIDDMVAIFQGRDSETVERTEDTHKLVKSHSQILVKIERNIERLYKSIETQIKNGKSS